MTKTQSIQQHIITYIEGLNLVDFLFDDCVKFILSLNYYKVSSVQKNLDELESYLLGLQEHYQTSLGELSTEEDEEAEEDLKDMDVALPLATGSEEMQIVNEIRGLFLLTAVEFAWGDKMRLQVRRFTEKEVRK